jgi:Ca-activated chloride channel homolog
MGRIMKQLSPFIVIILLLTGTYTYAQNAKAHMSSGSDLYLKKEYEKAAQQFQQAQKKEPQNATAAYNAGNALYKNKKSDEAMKAYDEAISNTDDKALKSKAWYNKGVTLSKQQKPEEAIDAYKNALRLQPNDEEARQNLQKAINELKKQQQNKKDDKDKDKKDKQKKDDPQQKEKDKQQQEKDKEKEKEQPKPQPSKLNKKQVEQLLKALDQKEKDLQDRMQKVRTSNSKQPEKDW